VKAERPETLPRGLIFGERKGEYVNVKDGSVLVYVPGGSFEVGHGEQLDENHAPRHAVELTHAFFIGKYEVSNAQFGTFVKATELKTMAETQQWSYLHVASPSDVATDIGEKGEGWEERRGASWRCPDGSAPCEPEHPVVHVTFAEAERYCTWAGLKLPTEAQWERAASGPRNDDPQPWGEDTYEAGPIKRANVADVTLHNKNPKFKVAGWPRPYDDGYERTAPVGSFPEGASRYGAVNMIGNVWEWCADGYDEFYYRRPPPKRDPLNVPDPSLPLQTRVIRGGSFATEWATIYRRRGMTASTSCDDLGFRVVLEVR
jgi:formylglycine-generating enzyme required for sulfatase activity